MTKDRAYKLFKNKIKENKEDVFIDYLRARKKLYNSTARYQGEPVEFLYQPLFLENRDINKFKNILDHLTAILNKVIVEYVKNPEFRDYFPFSPLLEKLILKDPGYGINFPMGRFDVFYDFDQQLKFCELNADGSTGMNEARVFQDIIRNSLGMENVKNEFEVKEYEFFSSWLDTLLTNYRNFIGEYSNNPRIAIMDFEGEGTESEFEEFKNRFNKASYPTIICDPRELTYKDGKLYYQDLVVDIIYRRATTARLIDESDALQDLFQAYLDEAVCMVGGFRSQLIHNKLIFALLHNKDQTPFLDKEDREFIDKHIPETYIFNYENHEQMQYLKNKKNDLLLKPFDRFGAKGVYVGANYSAEEWDNIIEDIKKENYLIQEFVSLPNQKMLTIEKGELFFEKYNYMIGLYVYNEEFAGLYSRCSRENIIGAIVESFTVPNFVLE